MIKNAARFLSVLLAFICLASSAFGVAAISPAEQIPFESYTYWNDIGEERKAVYSRPMYETDVLLDALSLGIKPFSTINDVFTDGKKVYTIKKRCGVRPAGQDAGDETMKRRDFCKGLAVTFAAGTLAPAAALPQAGAATALVGRAVPDDYYTLWYRSDRCGADLRHDYYYSDSLFDHPATEYDNQLALATLGMATATDCPWESDQRYWMEGEVGRADHIRDAFAKLGFTEVQLFNYTHSLNDTPDTVGCAIARELARPKTLQGVRVTVTAGPTQEPLDPVRYLTNHSTGKMGYAVARAAAMRGAEVTLIHGPTALQPVRFTEDVPITTAQQMYEAVTSRFDEMDVLVMAAAVADYRPAAVADDKIKKKDGDLSIAVERTPDILGTIGPKKKGQFLCGFSMETRDMLANSSAKLEKKNLDMVVANNLKVAGAGFGVDTNVVTFITPDGARELPLMSKDDVADAILDEILARKSK